MPVVSRRCFAVQDGSAERMDRALGALAPGAQAVLSSNQELLRTIVMVARRGVWKQSAVSEIAGEVAQVLYDYAIAHGAGYSGIGIYGPRAFYREATKFVQAWGA